MAETASPHSQTEASPLTGPSSIGSAVDPQGFATIHEVPRHKSGITENGSLRNQVRSARRPSGDSPPGTSLNSSIGQNYSDKQLELTPRRLHHAGPPSAGRGGWRQSEVSAASVQNGNHRNTKTDSVYKTPSPRNEKKGGFRNTLRRMFGRRSTISRTSMPNGATQRSHNTGDFVTAAEVRAKRSASVPSHGLLRTSGLSSHPPHQSLSGPTPVVSKAIPPQPERRPPERPARPRSVSVPSLIFNREEMEAVEAATTGLRLRNTQEQSVDAQNIGFAVTKGSNPKRRSRSVGEFRNSEHRMSPIQWRRWRRRSDEIRYWRESTELTSLGIKRLGSPDPEGKEDAAYAEIKQTAARESNNENFNFGLSGDAIPIQEQRIGLEERIVTLEIKLMDFEYAMSKLQASYTVPSQQQPPIMTARRQESVDSYVSSEAPQAPFQPSVSTPDQTPSMTSSKWAQDATLNARPTSVATTLKPHKWSNDQSVRSSLAGLTIEHYTTLVTLLRHEQSARSRLEEQVEALQQRLDFISTPHSSHSHAHSASQHSRSRSLSSQQRRHGYVETVPRGGGLVRQLRPRSSSYSISETDTDDDAHHDVYVTPDITPIEKERGEYERGAFERVPLQEEGMAF